MHGHIPQQLTVVIGSGRRLPGTPILNEGTILTLNPCSSIMLRFSNTVAKPV